MVEEKKTVVCLMGPTAANKTALAVALCDALPCEIVSVDSAQVYKGMNIGTAKLEPALLARYPHHLVDIRDPSEPYSAAEFYKDAWKKIKEIIARGHIPLLVGGTMLYFRVLRDGLAPLPSASQRVRSCILEMAKVQGGWSGIHRVLAGVDPDAAKRLHPNDAQRVQRALEVYMLSGKPLTQWHNEYGGADKNMLKYQWIDFAISPKERKGLHMAIAKRCYCMFKMGFVNEVHILRCRKDLALTLPSMRSVGYRQIWEALESGINFDDERMLERCIIATRQLAKRQLTWLRQWPTDINWLDSFSKTLLFDTLSIIRASCGDKTS